MKVKAIMTTEVKSCRPAAHLAAVAEVMRKFHYGVLPVVDDDGKVLGMITDRDICLAMNQKDHDVSSTEVSAVISSSVYGCAPRDDVKRALKTMRKQKVKRLPVVNRAGALKGILSIGDILLHTRKAKCKKGQARRYKDVARTLQAIYEPSVKMAAKSPPVENADDVVKATEDAE
jgi:CBS domain-containing protein